jgi:hypothetical protein
MKQQVLMLQGGGDNSYEADQALVDSLQRTLGTDYAVVYPKMPELTFALWRDQITQMLASLDEPLILVGHSFGASMWLKYLSEAAVQKRIAGIFLVAPPYWGAEDWEVDDFVLRKSFAQQLPQAPVYLYFNRDDEVVPFAHLALYKEKLPNVVIHTFDSGGHQFNDDLSAVAADIKMVLTRFGGG